MMSSDWFFIGTASTLDRYSVPAMFDPELITPELAVCIGDDAYMNEAMPILPHITPRPSRKEFP